MKPIPKPVTFLVMSPAVSTEKLALSTVNMSSFVTGVGLLVDGGRAAN